MKRKTDFKWVIRIIVTSIAMSMLFSLISSELLNEAGYIVAFALLMTFIFIGIIFDAIGMAVASADEMPFHSMASHKERGAKEALKLIRNSDKVSSICNDVVGDICGIVSGSTAAVISANLINDFSFGNVLTQLIVTGMVAGLTIGGKAVGKTAAINGSTKVVLFAGKVLSVLGGLFGKRK